jgi:hypothetical protein
MPVTSAKPATARTPRFEELDRVKLTKAISVEGRMLQPDLTGTVLLCHGRTAYEVEFDGIQDVFGVPAEFLERLVTPIT